MLLLAARSDIVDLSADGVTFVRTVADSGENLRGLH